MHKPYSETFGNPADFRVNYKFYAPSEGGRRMLPHQGLRCDFVYDDIDLKKQGAFIIWPEFEDNNGQIILEDKVSVPESGTARMTIIIKESRGLHTERIRVGMKCYFWEGKRTAECEVIEILGLHTNPRE